MLDRPLPRVIAVLLGLLVQFAIVVLLGLYLPTLGNLLPVNSYVVMYLLFGPFPLFVGGFTAARLGKGAELMNASAVAALNLLVACFFISTWVHAMHNIAIASAAVVGGVVAKLPLRIAA